MSTSSSSDETTTTTGTTGSATTSASSSLIHVPDNHRTQRTCDESLLERRPYDWTTTTDLGLNDVLFGRGTGPNEHVGNVRYRALVRTATEGRDYSSWTSIKKREAASHIVAIIKSMGGRFVKSVTLKKGDGMTKYVEVSDSVAINKVKQGFRHQVKYVASSKLRKNVGNRTLDCAKKNSTMGLSGIKGENRDVVFTAPPILSSFQGGRGQDHVKTSSSLSGKLSVHARDSMVKRGTSTVLPATNFTRGEMEELDCLNTTRVAVQRPATSWYPTTRSMDRPNLPYFPSPFLFKYFPSGIKASSEWEWKWKAMDILAFRQKLQEEERFLEELVAKRRVDSDASRRVQMYPLPARVPELGRSYQENDSSHRLPSNLASSKARMAFYSDPRQPPRHGPYGKHSLT